LDNLFAIFIQADRGFIVLQDKKTSRLVPAAVKHRREEDAEQIRISRTIVNGVITSKEAILSADAATDSRFDMAQSIVDFQIHSMMCAPLIGSESKVLGVLQIDTTDQRHRFTPEDLEVLAAVACQAAVAVENAQLHEIRIQEEGLERELTLARKIQRGFLPSAPPEVEGYEFFDFYDPARYLGGDYFDYVALPGGRLAVILADVSGKGVAASLLMAVLSAQTRFCLASEPTPAQSIAKLNQVFCDSAWEDRFVTMIAAILDPATHEVTLVNAGHMAPLLRHADGRVEDVGQEASGLPVGVADGMEYDEFVVKLEAGDSLTLYTDGIPDALNANEEFYGTERLLENLRTASIDGVVAMGKQILDDVKRFAGQQAQSDDMCVTIFGRTK
jgi:serine phosphatase RsbU (regulator of sigma subunit)